MRAKEPFTLTKRKIGKRIVFYYLVYDEKGIRHRLSTGCTTKTQALPMSWNCIERTHLSLTRKDLYRS